MITLPDDVNTLFDKVLAEISQNIRNMMERLWINWSHLGVEDCVKVNYITKLVQIEKELHRDVISETEKKLEVMRGQVLKLREETDELSKCLSVDITISDWDDNMKLADYKKLLEDQITGYREQVQHRRSEMERLMEWQRDLSEKLGVSMQELSDIPLPSDDELYKFKKHLEVLQSERDKRVEVFLNTQVELKDIMEKLKIKPQSKFEYAVTTSLSVDFQVTDLNMDRLAKLRQDLQEKYEQTNNRVLELRERLCKLWDVLEETHHYRENFLLANTGCHAEVEAAIKEEIKRCEQIKRQKIQVFVAKMRTRIKLMWDCVMFSASEREEFVHYYQDMFTEDTLTLHDLYLQKITNFYNENKQIFDLVMTRKNLWLKKTELEARASEPNRYHNRGGQLLKEERERKDIEHRIPKIEEQIRVLVREYEARSGREFTVDGKPILQVMEDEWKIYKAERHNKVSARKHALTPTTPLFRSLATSPAGKRNRTAAGLAATAERNRLPAKRPLITGSATKATTISHANHSALKRSAVTSVKRRISGRLAARAVAEGIGKAVRKLDYTGGSKAPKASGSILKHKRVSQGKRRSSSRRSITNTKSTIDSHEEECDQKDPLMETTSLTTYSEFKDRVHEKQVSRSSMINQKDTPITIKICEPINERNTPRVTPKKTPRVNHGPLTSKIGKENMQNACVTPKNMFTPNRLTRSTVKTNQEGFATPRAPLSAAKMNFQRQNTVNSIAVKTPPPSNINRSRSHTNLMGAKDVPPII